MAPALGAAAQTLAIRDKVIRAVIIISPVRITSNNSQGIRVILGSLIVANIMFSPQALLSESKSFVCG